MLPPTLTDRLIGVMEIPVRVAAVTVRVEEPETEPEVAVTVQPPALTAAAIALALTVHTLLGLEDHTTELVTSWLLPSVKTALADNCRLVPFARLAVEGLTVIDLIDAVLTVTTELA
jgi:hypothetical protein